MFPKSSIITLLGVTALASVKAKGTSNKTRKFHSTVLIKVVQTPDIYQFYRYWTGSNDLGSLTDGTFFINLKKKSDITNAEKISPNIFVTNIEAFFEDVEGKKLPNLLFILELESQSPFYQITWEDKENIENLIKKYYSLTLNYPFERKEWRKWDDDKDDYVAEECMKKHNDEDICEDQLWISPDHRFEKGFDPQLHAYRMDLESKYIQNNPEPVKHSYLDLLSMEAEGVDLSKKSWFDPDRREARLLSEAHKPRLLWYLGEDVLSAGNKRRFKTVPKHLLEKSSKISREANSNDITVFSHEIGKTLNKRLSRLRLR